MWNWIGIGTGIHQIYVSARIFEKFGERVFFALTVALLLAVDRLCLTVGLWDRDSVGLRDNRAGFFKIHSLGDWHLA